MKIFILLVTILSHVSVCGQSYRISVSEMWTSLSLDTMVTKSIGTKHDAYGNSYILGVAYDSLGNSNIIVEKINSTSGASIWKTVYDGGLGSRDIPSDFVIDDSSNIYVSCGLTVTSLNGVDFGVLKLGNTGSVIWTYTLNGDSSSDDGATSLYVDNVGSIYATGFVTNRLTDQDVAIIKLNVNGGLIWNKSYDDSRDYGVNISYLFMEDKILVTGISEIDTAFTRVDAHRVNPTTGVITNTASSGVIDNTGVLLKGIHRSSVDNQYLIFGRKWDADIGQNVGFIMCLDSLLGFRWDSKFESESSLHSEFMDVTDADSGRFICVGYKLDSNYVTRPIITELDDNGLILWSQEFNNSIVGGLNCVILGDSNHYFSAGHVYNNGNRDALLVSFKSTGTPTWILQKDGQNGLNDMAHELSRGNTGDIFLTGEFEKSLNNPVYQTVKYDYTFFSFFDDFSDTNLQIQPNRVLIRFAEKSIKSNALISNTNTVHGSLSDFIESSTISLLKSKIDTADIGISNWEVEKAVPFLTESDTLSISRNGDTVRIPSFYTLMILHLPTEYDEQLVADSLSTLDSLILYSKTIVANGIALYGPNEANDPKYTTQHSLFSTTYPSGHINIENSWAIEDGHKEIRVGIMDQAVRYGHQELVPNFKDGYDARDMNRLFHYDYESFYGIHSTPIAGLIGGTRNNNQGSAGIAGGNDLDRGVSLYNAVIFGPCSYSESPNYGADDVQILRAFLYLILDVPKNQDPAYSCHILNNSWGETYLGAQSGIKDIYLEALHTAHLNGALVCHGAGNAYNSFDISHGGMPLGYPGSIFYSDKYLMTIGAFGTTGLHESYSNQGGNLDLLAPGSSTLLGDLPKGDADEDRADRKVEAHEYDNYLSLTSGACPHVSGVAALILSYYHVNKTQIDYFYPEDIEHIIEFACTDITGSGYGSGYDERSGWGRLNAGLALESIVFPDYKLFHFIEETNMSNYTSSIVEFGRLIEIVTDKGTEKYRANVYSIVSTFDFSTDLSSAGYVYYNGWERWYNTSGMPNGSRLNPYSSFSNLISISSTEIVIQTYVYELTQKVLSGSTQNLSPTVMYPSEIDELTFGFTIHGVSSTLNTKVPEESMFKMFPNPNTKNTCMISGIQDYFSQNSQSRGILEIYSVEGKLIKTINVCDRDLVNNLFSFETSNMITGTYFVKLNISDTSIPIGKLSVIH